MNKWYYENGQLEQEVNVTDGYRNGVEKGYYLNGDLEYQINCKDDKENG